MADYGNPYDDRPRRDKRPPPSRPYPDDDYTVGGDGSSSHPRQPHFDPRVPAPGQGNLPPPPLGEDALRPAMKREGSRSRVPPDTRPVFPEEASYLGKNAPDLEAKDRAQHRRFRDKRDGYESEEGEMHRKARGPSGGRRRPPPDDYDDRPPADARPRRPRDDRDRYGRDQYDDAPPPRSRRPRDPRDRYDSDPYDEPPRRRRDDRREYLRDDRKDDRRNDRYDDPPAPRRRGPRPEVEYGSDPIPIRRRNSERYPAQPSRRRRDDYSDEEDDYDTRRSGERRRRASLPPRRRDRYDDEDDYYDDRDRRRRGGDRRDRPPKEIKIGGYDVGPLVENGKKHYATLAPIVTPLVLNAARKYLSGAK